THRFDERMARFVRIDIRQAGQSIFEPLARIFEIEVYGTGSAAPAAAGAGLEQIAHSELQGAVGLYPRTNALGEAQLLETGNYDGARGNFSTLGSGARSIDVAAGYTAKVCAADGACESFAAGRYGDLPASISGKVATVEVRAAG
ncbi:MAG: hypothetical protein Q7T55_17660, partial [Solirubrobacteraceae bacterium]|nr:hypothetical protein [Solirubrobacteraceae bacterium]